MDIVATITIEGWSDSRERFGPVRVSYVMPLSRNLYEPTQSVADNMTIIEDSTDMFMLRAALSREFIALMQKILEMENGPA